jgi:hypothetical protein
MRGHIWPTASAQWSGEPQCIPGQKAIAAHTGRPSPAALTTDVGPGRPRSMRVPDGCRAQSGYGGAVAAGE